MYTQTFNNFPQFVQAIEQRSISFPNVKDHKHPGVQSLPRVTPDRNQYKKTAEEKQQLHELKNAFDLIAWNERNRPGNNKN